MYYLIIKRFIEEHYKSSALEETVMYSIWVKKSLSRSRVYGRCHRTNGTKKGVKNIIYMAALTSNW